MSEKSFPERLFEKGFRDLVSVIPPGAQLMPSSKIAAGSVGKVPGRKHASGLWAGYNWRIHTPTVDDVRRWVFDGANVGLRATMFPGVDIDCTEPGLAQMIEDCVRGLLGPAPVRIGRAPKRLLMYRAAEPFTRLRLIIETPAGAKHLVEILGEGQQYLVYGTHPSGAAYSWDVDPTTVELQTITAEQAASCLDTLQAMIELAGLGTVKREGDGKRQTRVATTDQQALLAPSLDALRAAVSVIPNTDDIFPTRDDYVRMGYAIRAAAGAENEGEGYEIFAEWAGRHEADGRVEGNPETWLSDWRRLTPPFSVGWSYLAELARTYGGYNDVANDFLAFTDGEEPDEEPEESAPYSSDQYLAEKIIEMHRGELRYVPQKGKWAVWDGARWAIDDMATGENLIMLGLKNVALRLLRTGDNDKQRAANSKLAVQICSAAKATAVSQCVRVNRAVAVNLNAFDHDAWTLNTPGGIVDLQTGKIGPSEPDALCSKLTRVPPDFAGVPKEWLRFLYEASGENQELIDFLQRYAGYCLTGSVKEEQLLFIYGPGRNGKTVFKNVLVEILGDYSTVSTMDTFTEGYGEKHSTDLAMLVGSRFVTASETSSAKRWDDQRVKALTGDEPVTARFMHKDNFTYRPQFKLMFTGNHQPEIRVVDKAMRRRIQMVPFTVTPKEIDDELSDKLREEYPAILAWMIEGCLKWQREGLNPPAVVQAATEEYFENEDAYGAWIGECLEFEPGAFSTTQELFESWQEWAVPRKEPSGSTKRLAKALGSRGFERERDTETRQRGFRGVKVKRGKDLLSKI